jgi:hypothetical protein
MKTPPRQNTDSEARALTEKFIKKYGQKASKTPARPKKDKKKK